MTQRQIKFRGKRVDNGEGVKGDHCRYMDADYILPYAGTCLRLFHSSKGPKIYEITGWIEVIPESVGQYTGHKDKNGVKIWEDDIYKDAHGNVFRVQMKVDGWGLFPVKKCIPVRSLYWWNVCVHDKGEVIGTVHNNPELLE